VRWKSVTEEQLCLWMTSFQQSVIPSHIFTYGFGFQFPKVEVSSFKNLVETDRKKDERTDTTDRITFPANAVSKKFLQFVKLFLYNTGVHQMARGYSVYVPYPRASVMSQTPYKAPQAYKIMCCSIYFTSCIYRGLNLLPVTQACMID